MDFPPLVFLFDVIYLPMYCNCWMLRFKMPVFQETAHASRDLRVRRSRARPLPRLSGQPEISWNNGQDGDEKYEVVVIGVRVKILLILNACN